MPLREWKITEIRRIIREYKKAKWGSKTEVLEKYGIGYSHIHFWRQKYSL